MANTPDIEIFYFLLAGTLGMFILSAGVVGFVVIYHIKLQKHRLKLQELETDYHKQLLESNMQEVENERLRISKDLHDEIGSIFSVLGIKLDELQSNLEKPDPETKRVLAESRNTIGLGIQSIRRISHDIIPPALETFGLAAALEDLCARFEGGPSGLPVTLSVPAPIKEPPHPTGLVIFRIVQELLQNTLRHAEATHVLLQLEDDGRGLSLLYVDDGKGFLYRQTGTGKGIGLLNLQSRVQQLKATLNLDTAPGKGVRVHIHIPNLNTSTEP